MIFSSAPSAPQTLRAVKNIVAADLFVSVPRNLHNAELAEIYGRVLRYLAAQSCREEKEKIAGR